MTVRLTKNEVSGIEEAVPGEFSGLKTWSKEGDVL